MLTMIALGFSSGFPLLLVFGTLNLWLKDAGISYAAIGLFSLVKTPYSFKWAWSPIIDRIRLPLFCRLGRRRGWAFFTQIILLFSILGMSTVEPAATPFTMAFFAVLVTVASASQDIVLDAYRIESFNSKEQGAGVAVFVLGYRFGLVFSGAGAIWMASAMNWNDVYKIMALGAIVGMLAVLCSREPAKNEKKPKYAIPAPFANASKILAYRRLRSVQGFYPPGRLGADSVVYLPLPDERRLYGTDGLSLLRRHGIQQG